MINDRSKRGENGRRKMRIRAHFYRLGGVVIADCPEAGIAVRGDSEGEALSKLRSTLKHHFIDFSIETKD